ncbi:hypothetical protein, partial [Robertmurraya siralis]|uniref:hypothetical protein n=1 Tax=Robertmurraya siralis TaxID=77777 RepID=UPI0040330D13
LELVSECGAEGKPFQLAFKAKAGKRGFQPQSKPPVHTGGFDLSKAADFRINLKFLKIKVLSYWLRLILVGTI